TMVVVGACWGAALLMVVFALYTVHLSAAAKQDAVKALVAEPILPQIARAHIDTRDAQALTERLQHDYPDLKFTLGRDGSLQVVATDGAQFREWMTALSYIDTISPQYRWSMQEFCVGKCSGSGLMSATLIGERVSFKAPDSGDRKN
ncbi:MAG TPA: hypothetical protein VMV79_00375, partial [Alphaproteobacteria bacterium]|nr:hypothetical protein [Alphaproteobacteria bacterium]